MYYGKLLKYTFKSISKISFFSGVIFLFYLIINSLILNNTFHSNIINGEYLMSLFGIFIITNNSSKELEDYADIFKTKCFKIQYVILLKMLILNVYIIFIAFLYSVFISTESPSDYIFTTLFGFFVTAFISGSVGFFIYTLTLNTALSYFVAFFYFFVEFVTGGGITKNLYLFGLINSVYITNKIYLFGIAMFIYFLAFMNIRKTT